MPAMKWGAPDTEGLVKFLVEEKSFNEDRVRAGRRAHQLLARQVKPGCVQQWDRWPSPEESCLHSRYWWYLSADARDACQSLTKVSTQLAPIALRAEEPP